MAKLRQFLAILCALFLISCGEAARIEVLPQPTTIVVPAQNRSCAAIPAPPNPDVSDQKDVAAWLPTVYGAHAECRSDLRSTIRIVDSHNAEAKRIAAENAKKVEDADQN